MEWSLVFFLNSILLGVGLAMDAFSVSLANGLNNPTLSKRGTCGIAGTFALFQALMPLLGWVCVHTAVRYFQAFEPFIPWIALLLLSYIGGKMLYDGFKNKTESSDAAMLGFGTLLLQGVATSIDALSVGFTISEYDFPMALVCAALIAAVTFVICLAGVEIGKRSGVRLAGKASLLGGFILIAIGIEIFVSGIV